MWFETWGSISWTLLLLSLCFYAISYIRHRLICRLLRADIESSGWFSFRKLAMRRNRFALRVDGASLSFLRSLHGPLFLLQPPSPAMLSSEIGSSDVNMSTSSLLSSPDPTLTEKGRPWLYLNLNGIHLRILAASYKKQHSVRTETDSGKRSGVLLEFLMELAGLRRPVTRWTLWKLLLVQLFSAFSSLAVRLLHRFVAIHCQDCRIELIDGEDLDIIYSVAIEAKYAALELRPLAPVKALADIGVSPSLASGDSGGLFERPLPWTGRLEFHELSVQSAQAGALVDSCSKLTVRAQLCRKKGSTRRNILLWPQLWIHCDGLGFRADHFVRYLRRSSGKTTAAESVEQSDKTMLLDQIAKFLADWRFEMTIAFTGSKASLELDQQQRMQLLAAHRSAANTGLAETIDRIDVDNGNNNASGRQLKHHSRAYSARRESMLRDAGNLLLAGPRFSLEVSGARLTMRSISNDADLQSQVTSVDWESSELLLNLIAVPSLIPTVYGRDKLPVFRSTRQLVRLSTSSIGSLLQQISQKCSANPSAAKVSKPQALQIDLLYESVGVEALFDLPVLSHFFAVFRNADQSKSTAVPSRIITANALVEKITKVLSELTVALTGEVLIRDFSASVINHRSSVMSKSPALLISASMDQFKGSVDSQRPQMEQSNSSWRQVLVVNSLLSSIELSTLVFNDLTEIYQLLKPNIATAGRESASFSALLKETCTNQILRLSDVCWVNNCTLAARDLEENSIDCFIDSTFTIADLNLNFVEALSQPAVTDLLINALHRGTAGESPTNVYNSTSLESGGSPGNAISVELSGQFICAKSAFSALNSDLNFILEGTEASVTASFDGIKPIESSSTVKWNDISLSAADSIVLRTAGSTLTHAFDNDLGNDGKNRLSLEFGLISMNYGLVAHYCLWMCVSKFQSFIGRTVTGSRVTQAVTKKPQRSFAFNLGIGELMCRLALPDVESTPFTDRGNQREPVVVFLNLSRIKAHLNQSTGDHLRCDRFVIATDINDDIFTLRQIHVENDFDPEVKERVVRISASLFEWYLPFGFEFDRLLESISCFVKAVKQLQSSGSLLAPAAPRPSPIGPLREQLYQNLPAVDIRFQRLAVRFQDNMLDKRLATIFRIGFDEQRHRIDRERLMHRKVSQLKQGVLQRPDQTTPGRLFIVSDKGQTKAWQVLQQANSAIWVRRLRPLLNPQVTAAQTTESTNSTSGDYQSRSLNLFSVDAEDVLLQIRPPVLSNPDSLEKSLSNLDRETPPNLQYETLLAAQFTLEMSGMIVTLRDMKPVFSVPSNRGYKVRICGPIFIAEHIHDIQKSSRLVRLGLSGNSESRLPTYATIFRTIAPTKLYGALQAEISRNVPDSANLDSIAEDLPLFSYGVSIEPHLADLNRVFSSLTPPSADTSAPLPFWDKIRLLLHGRVEVNVLPNAAFRIQINGTRRAHAVQTSGLDVIMKSGIRLRCGSFHSNMATATAGVSANTANSTVDSIILESGLPITIMAGEVIFAVPTIDETTIWSYTPADPLASNQSVTQREVVAKLCGGVALGFEIEYETAGGSHVDVNMKALEYSDELHDAFSGIRSKWLNLNVFMAAPAQKTLAAGARGNFNYANLNLYLIEHFVQFAFLYQSPLTVLPIRRGKIFAQQQQQIIKTQKLSRFIKQINCRVHLQSALLGYGHQSDKEVEIGFRGRVRDFQLAVLLQQQNFIPGQKGASWDVLGSDFDLTDLECRVYHSCPWFEPARSSSAASSSSNLPPMATVGETEKSHASTPLQSETDRGSLIAAAALRLQESEIWAMSDGVEAMSNIGGQRRFKFLPFFSTPKLVYFRQGSHGNTFEVWDPETGEIRIPERDLSLMQLSLMQKRVEEIEAEIARDQETIRQWEDRIAVYFDERLQRQSKALVEKMATLYERKALIESQIRRRGRSGTRKQPLKPSVSIFGHQAERLRHLRRESAIDTSSTLGSANSHRRKESVFSIKSDANENRRDNEFRHHYVIHTLNILWNLELRNAVYKFVDLEQQQSSVGYYLRASSLRILREILSRAVNDGLSTSGNTSGSNSRRSQSSDNLQANASTIDRDLAQQLLDQLIADRKTNFVVGVEQSDNRGASEAALKDPSNPLYVSPNFRQRNQSVFQFFYPQISFDIPLVAKGKLYSTTHSKSDTSKGGSVIVFAENMNLKQIDIEDDGQLVKTRHTFTIENGQFFSVFRQQVLRSMLAQGAIRRAEDMQWPVWVPIENLLRPAEDDLATGKPQEQVDLFSRFVNRTTVIVQFDSCSPVYLRTFRKRASDGTDAGGIGYTDSIDTSEDLEFVNSVFVRFPKLNIHANSDQYCAVYDIIYHLLAYRDPDRKRRTEHIQTMLLALRKEQDLRSSVAVVEQMQGNIRDYSEALRQNAFSAPPATISPIKSHFSRQDDADFVRWEEQRRSAALALILFMDALKALSFQRKSKDSSRKSFRTVIDANQLSWILLGEMRAPICELKVTNANYYNLSSEDRSKLHTLEIEQLYVLNRLPVPFLRETVAPYGAEERDADYFSRHKMLRLYWRGLPPVAGIPIIEHFEVNIFPLVFQPTYELSKAEYFYRKKAASRFLATSADPMAQSSMIDLDQSSSSRNGSSFTHERAASTGTTERRPRSLSASNRGQELTRSASGLNSSILSKRSDSSRTERAQVRINTAGLRTTTDGSSGSVVPIGRPRAVSSPLRNSPLAEQFVDPQQLKSSASPLNPTRRSSREEISMAGAISVTSGLSDSLFTPASSIASATAFIPFSPERTIAAANQQQGFWSRDNQIVNNQRRISVWRQMPGTSSSMDLLDFPAEGELKLMKDRASANKTFVYIKVPGVTHCISYHGEKEKNIEDLYQIVLRVPTLEYRNKTWTWLEFINAVRKDIKMALLAQSGSLIRESLVKRRRLQGSGDSRNAQASSSDNGSVADSQRQATDDDSSSIPSGRTSRTPSRPASRQK